MLDIGFDIISDLNLEPNDNFNWEDKATSLYCILSGNISSDVQTMVNVLSHLSRFYQGVFYTPGLLEYDSSPLQNINQRTSDIQNIAKKLPNVILLHHNIVIVDGVAVVCPQRPLGLKDRKVAWKACACTASTSKLCTCDRAHVTFPQLQRSTIGKKIN